MEGFREVKMPSGAILKVGLAPFVDAKELFQAILAEVKLLDIDLRKEVDQATIVKLMKDLFCSGFSSKRIEAGIWKCLARCTYNSGTGAFKVEESTFEPVQARQDFIEACMEVVKENTMPFMKSLYAESQRHSQTILKDLA